MFIPEIRLTTNTTEPDQNATQTRSVKDRVTVLITAESIIAGFMIAYGAVNSQLLVSWGCKSFEAVCDRTGLVGTYIAGVFINGVVLTSLASIMFLLSSIPTNEEAKVKSKPEEHRYRQNYNAGYDLFIATILGTAVFVVSNTISIHNFTVTLSGMPIPVQPVADLLYYEFWLYVVFLAALLAMALIFDCEKVLSRFEHHALLRFLCVAAIAVIVFDSLVVLAFWIIVSHLSCPLTCTPASSAGVFPFRPMCSLT
jgi:NADH:ubiquinone oxidoreductase subunit 6 (subunit J)